VAAFACTVALAPHIERASFTFFWVAVLFAAWFAGLVPAVLAALASVVAVHFYVAPAPGGAPRPVAGELLTMALFVGASTLVSALAAALARVQERLERQGGELAAANEALRHRQVEIEEQAVELEHQTEEARSTAEELEQANARLQAVAESTGAAQQAAEAARGRLAAVLDGLGDAVAVLDRDWRYTYLNPAARRTLAALGRDPDAALGAVVWELLPELRGTPFETERRRAARERRVVEIEEYLPGIERRLETRVVPGADGSITTFARDVTEAHRARQAEQQAADRARRLLAVTSGLGAARTAEEVAEVIFREGLAAVGADAGSLALVRGRRGDDGVGPVVDEGVEIEVVRTHGYPDAVVAAFRRFPLHAGRPLSDAVLTQRPQLLVSREDWAARYPEAQRALADVGYEGYAAIPVVTGGRVLGALSASFRGRADFDEATRTFLATLGEQCGLALARARAFEAEHRAREASAFLAEASRVLSSSLDYESTLRALAEAAVPTLGDWCAVDVVRDPAHAEWPPTLDRLAVVHRDPAMVALGMELTTRYPTDWTAETGTPAVLRTGEPLFLPVITDAMIVAGARDPDHLALLRALRFSAVIVVPLVARGVTLGLLTLCMTDSGRCYDDADLALARDLAQRAATAVDNARLYRDARAARADAEAANRAKSQFLSTMSHELRTPLNAITGYTELLEMGVRGPITAPQRADLARIRRSANVLMALVNDVLNFARLEAGQVEVRLDGVPLARVLADLEVLVAPQVTAKGLACTFESCDESLMVRADPDRLTQILTNLLTNAIKFTPEGGRIGVACRVANDPSLAHITVTDDGRGVAPDQLDRIFEPFVQVDRHLNPESQQGVGLGLAISRDLARAMGGDLTAASTPEVGSSFIVTLPRA
jgi:signal transduction histidine kinase